MEDLDQAGAKPSIQGEMENANRKLRRLRTILVFLLVLFLFSLIWFSL